MLRKFLESHIYKKGNKMNSGIIKPESLGKCTVKSPLAEKRHRFYNGEGIAIYNRTKDLGTLKSIENIKYYELGGAREKIFFNPSETNVGIVTCGGLCPGLNDVIRAITFCCLESYKVREVLGFQYGFEGLVARYYHQPVNLNTENTDDIHEKGGTILKSSRGEQPSDEIVNTLVHYGINILFTIGGDGTQRGARDIVEEIKKRNLDIAVVGIPKTIDNDISVVEPSFGFETAVDEAWKVVNAAHAEASAYKNGIGFVKLMGRHSGWIATSTSLANSNVNFCLIPEVPFDLEGRNGFLNALFKRIKKRGHAVIVAAEGTGQEFMRKSNEKDKSGNKRLNDIGPYMQDAIIKYFAEKNTEVNIKYFDPSYQIRSCPANARDSEYCLRLGNNAVHAAMAGKTNMIVGMHQGRLVHIPINMIGPRKQVEPEGWIWQTVLQATHQPPVMTNKKA